ncbi:MAG: tetratricopeptide repeat protein [Acidobacteriaceae bacterium]|nr:tetratricopeptide repeat protein [Acidobacteriaceae bacterium]
MPNNTGIGISRHGVQGAKRGSRQSEPPGIQKRTRSLSISSERKQPLGEPDPQLIAAQLRRILASREFAASARMCRFLRLVVTEAMQGRSDDLKEYRLGLDVFDRPDSFDPGIDPIVRVEARRLREKIARYYAHEGRHDEILIALPKGAYIPSFARREPAKVEPVATKEKRIAVLPFVDLSGARRASAFADGLTWELMHGLTRIEGMFVVAWNSAAQLRTDGIPDISLIREKLQVQVVLTGSIRRCADRLRVVAQMIDTSSGIYLWSETYERRLDDTADIQQEISNAIIATLRLRLETGNSGRHPAIAYHPEAYQLYLRGRGQWNQRTEAGLRAALTSFQQAVALDTRFALAYAGIADVYALLAEYGLKQPSEVMAQARSAALRALEIDPSLGEAHCSLGLLVALSEWNWAEAEAHFQRALDLNPGYATTHHWLACDFLPIFGRLEEAVREIEIALVLDPLSPVLAEAKAFLFMLQGRYEEAEIQLHAIIDANPSFFRAYATLGRVLTQGRHYDEAIQMFERAIALANSMPNLLGALGQACGSMGQQARAREILARLEAMRRNSYAPATALALTCLGLNEISQALTWLEEGVRHREPSVVMIGVHPAYSDLRGHPRFERLITNHLRLPAALSVRR